MKEIVLPLPDGIDSQITDRVKRLATEHWGGFTETNAKGGWESPNGEVITEPVNLLTVLAENEHEDGTTPKQWAETMARVVSEESDEESVMWFVRQIHAGGFE